MSDLEHDAFDTEPTELSRDERRLRDASDALDAAGVPRSGELIGLELDLPERIQRLADDRDAKELAREREAKEANRWAGEVRQLRSDIEQANVALARHGAPTDELMIYQSAEWLGRVLVAINDALDFADVPVAAPEDSPVSAGQPMGLEARVRWLLTEFNMLRAMKEALDRAAAENSAEGDPTELAHRVMVQVQSQPYSIVYALAKQVVRDHQHTIQLIAERDQLRRMHDGVSADLDRERREHQEAMGEAAARELKLTEERDDARSDAEEADAAIVNAEGLRLQCEANERTIARLRAKIERLTGKPKKSAKKARRS